MSRISDVVAGIVEAIYEHDPNILKEHEQAAKAKFKQLDSNTSDSEELRKTYHDKMKEFLYKPVDPEDVSSILHVFDERKEP